jgi:septum formation protein
VSYDPAQEPSKTAPRLVLASTSPFRASLLARLGLPFTAVAPGIDEASLPGELPAHLAARLAAAKAACGAAPDTLVIGSDQVASLGGARLRKPGNRTAALHQLTACQGKDVLFHTAVTLHDGRSGASSSHVDVTAVRFAMRSRAELERYVDTEQPFDCAGSFKAEGLGIALFERIESHDPTALIGLPLIWLAGALKAAGLDPLGAA